MNCVPNVNNVHTHTHWHTHSHTTLLMGLATGSNRWRVNFSCHIMWVWHFKMPTCVMEDVLLRDVSSLQARSDNNQLHFVIKTFIITTKQKVMDIMWQNNLGILIQNNRAHVHKSYTFVFNSTVSIYCGDNNMFSSFTWTIPLSTPKSNWWTGPWKKIHRSIVHFIHLYCYKKLLFNSKWTAVHCGAL